MFDLYVKKKRIEKEKQDNFSGGEFSVSKRESGSEKRKRGDMNKEEIFRGMKKL